MTVIRQFVTNPPISLEKLVYCMYRPHIYQNIYPIEQIPVSVASMAQHRFESIGRSSIVSSDKIEGGTP